MSFWIRWSNAVQNPTTASSGRPFGQVIHDLLADAANLAAFAELRARDGDLSSEEFALAKRADAWAYQVKALAESFLHELGVPGPEEGPAR